MTKFNKSERVLSGPIAAAIVQKFLMEFKRFFESSDLSSSMSVATGERLVLLLIF